MKQYVKLFVLLFCLLSCEKRQCEDIEFHANGKIKTSVCIETNQYCYKEYYKNGQIETKYCVDQDGNIQGEVFSFRKDGSLHKKSMYRQDLIDGLSLVYDKSGNVISKTYYIRDSLLYSEYYSSEDTSRFFSPDVTIKNADIIDSKVNVQLVLNFPLQDTSIKLDNVFYGVGMMRHNSKDSLVYGREDTLLAVEKLNHAKEVNLFFDRETPSILYYYIVDTTRFEIIDPPKIDLSYLLTQK